MDPHHYYQQARQRRPERMGCSALVLTCRVQGNPAVRHAHRSFGPPKQSLAREPDLARSSSRLIADVVVMQSRIE
jgi:hypothetical protein